MGQNLGIGDEIVGPNLTINTVGNGFFTEEEALYQRVDSVGRFATPAVLAEAIFPYDTTTQLSYLGTDYYIHYRNVLGSTAATLTTVLDSSTIIFTYNIN